MLDSIKAALKPIEPGPVPPEKYREIVALLSEAWDHLSGGDDQAMAGYKVPRAEKLHWDPPNLTFRVERHGGTVFGSVYAEIQPWTVNLDEETAHCDYPIGRRQVDRRQATFDTQSVAEELAQKIADGADDPRLRWTKDRKKVQARVSEILPAGSQQTTQGRAKRLRRDLAESLEPLGWRSVGRWWELQQKVTLDEE